jgi:formylglycine-generating enzyme required for sulfatase activity
MDVILLFGSQKHTSRRYESSRGFNQLARRRIRKTAPGPKGAVEPCRSENNGAEGSVIDRISPAASTDFGETPLIVPETVLISSGTLALRLVDGSARVVDIVAFRLGRTPVTNREYAPFIVARRMSAPQWWNDPRFSSPLQPVVGVTWDEAAAYCDWLGEAAGGGWRLPTEAEWEFAASGGLIAPRTAWGETLPPGEIPEGPLEGPWETGRGTPNGYGLLDAGTIVHEWCADWREPATPSGGPRRRASRGGSWRHEIRWSSPSAATSLPPNYRYSDYGFRVARAAKQG